jgi:hypothetical protein
MITHTCTKVAASHSQGTFQSNQANFSQMRTQCGHRVGPETGERGMYRESGVNTGERLAAPQGFEPRYADPEFVVAY